MYTVGMFLGRLKSVQAIVELFIKDFQCTDLFFFKIGGGTRSELNRENFYFVR